MPSETLNPSISCSDDGRGALQWARPCAHYCPVALSNPGCSADARRFVEGRTAHQRQTETGRLTSRVRHQAVTPRTASGSRTAAGRSGCRHLFRGEPECRGGSTNDSIGEALFWTSDREKERVYMRSVHVARSLTPEREVPVLAVGGGAGGGGHVVDGGRKTRVRQQRGWPRGEGTERAR